MWANLYYLNYRTGVGMAFVHSVRFYGYMHNRNFSLSHSHDITQFFLSFFPTLHFHVEAAVRQISFNYSLILMDAMCVMWKNVRVCARRYLAR